MSVVARRLGSPDTETIVFVSCFGDNGSMYEALADTVLGETYGLVVTDLPGFGEAPPEATPLDLERSAVLIAEIIERFDARIVVAHSLGSITASLAATMTAPQVHTVISIEGNLTPADAYFSGSAAEYATPEDFRASFLARLDNMAPDSEVVARYRTQVAQADPGALWQLGCDAHRFSATRSPGQVLMEAAPRVHYLYNPDNTPPETLAWLEIHDLPRSLLPNASHWKMVDQPELLADTILDVLSA